MRLSGEGENVLTSPETVGERIRIEGFVFDGDRNHIEDALIELWQANAAGRYNHPADDRDDVPLDSGVHRLRSLRERLQDRRVLVPHHQAGSVSRIRAAGCRHRISR